MCQLIIIEVACHSLVFFITKKKPFKWLLAKYDINLLESAMFKVYILKQAWLLKPTIQTHSNAKLFSLNYVVAIQLGGVKENYTYFLSYLMVLLYTYRFL